MGTIEEDFDKLSDDIAKAIIDEPAPLLIDEYWGTPDIVKEEHVDQQKQNIDNLRKRHNCGNDYPPSKFKRGKKG